MENPQGSPAPAESNAPQGSPVAESNVGLPNEVPQQFIVESPTAPVNVPQEQTVPQGQNQPMTPAVAPDLAKHYQSIADQRQAEIYRLQQELQARQVQTPQVNKNPYDPQTQYEQWDAYRIKEIVSGAVEEQTQRLVGFAQRQAQVQQDMQWQQAHPQVDINLVKQWGQMNGVNNLDHAFTLMTLPNTMQTVQTQAAQTAFNQFRQPQQNVATPTRGGQQAGGTIQLSYEQMAQEYANTKGRAYEQWSPALRNAFDKETYKRSDGGR